MLKWFQKAVNKTVSKTFSWGFAQNPIVVGEGRGGTVTSHLFSEFATLVRRRVTSRRFFTADFISPYFQQWLSFQQIKSTLVECVSPNLRIKYWVLKEH